jgi:hypothetical protein
MYALLGSSDGGIATNNGGGDSGGSSGNVTVDGRMCGCQTSFIASTVLKMHQSRCY